MANLKEYNKLKYNQSIGNKYWSDFSQCKGLALYAQTTKNFKFELSKYKMGKHDPGNYR